MMKKQFRNNQMVEMREKGMSYRELSKLFGVSHQRVQQIVGKHDGRYFRTITKENCVYDAIRNWLNENRISLAEFTRRMYCNTEPNNYYNTIGRLSGKVELTKTYIDKILSITNLTYEDAFKRSDNIGT